MSEQIDKIFESYKNIFLGRISDIKEYLLKYLKKVFINQDVIKVERIDATDMIKTSGYRTNISSWRNSYRNIIVSSYLEIGGEQKRYDYKFFFTEEKLSSELLEQVEVIIKDINRLKNKYQFSEAIAKINQALDLIKEENDTYYSRYFKDLRSEVAKEEALYNRKIQKLETLEEQLVVKEQEENYDAAIKECKEIIKLAKTLKKKNLENQYNKRIAQIKTKIEEKKERERIHSIEEKIHILKEKVKEKRTQKEFKNALILCDELISNAEKIDQPAIVEQYNEIKAQIQNEYDAILLKENEIAELENRISQNDDLEKYEEALQDCNKAIELCQQINDIEREQKYKTHSEELKAKIKQKKILEEQKSIQEEIIQLEEKAKNKKETNNFDDALVVCKKIIELAKLINNSEKEQEYTNLAEEIQRKIEEKKEIQGKIAELENDLTAQREQYNYDQAIRDCEQLIEISKSINNAVMTERYTSILEEIKKEKAEKEKEKIKSEKEEKISTLKQSVREKQEEGDFETAIKNCEEIIVIAQQIDKPEIQQEYSQLAEELKQLIIEKKKEDDEEALKKQKTAEIRKAYEERELQKKQKQEELIEKSREYGGMMEVDENVVPIIDEFSVNDLIGDLSDDVNEMLEQIGALLNDHRVEVKNNIKNSALLTSTTGEVVEIEKEITVEQKENDEGEVQFNVQSGVENPFDDILEEAIITNMIPYNFEILNLELNGEEVKELPDKTLTKDGLEVKWQLNNIKPKEKVEINYDLRRRISRTVIFLLEDQLKIIKTHSHIEDADPNIVGFYNARLPFKNTYNSPLSGLIIEDIIPLYYLHNIKEPTSYIPDEMKAQTGNLVKWNIGELAPTTVNYHYKLLELFLFEELKINVEKLDKEGYQALLENNFSESLGKYSEILKILEDFIK
ncbi:MAG: hypothetical protein ACTSR8_10235 [Promethearchaeota archaeon]